MKNRHGVPYDFRKITETQWEFVIEESEMQYMRFGGREGEKQIDMTDLGFVDPSGGPFIGVGKKLPFGTVKRISCEDGKIYLEVEA